MSSLPASVVLFTTGGVSVGAAGMTHGSTRMMWTGAAAVTLSAATMCSEQRSEEKAIALVAIWTVAALVLFFSENTPVQEALTTGQLPAFSTSLSPGHVPSSFPMDYAGVSEVQQVNSPGQVNESPATLIIHHIHHVQPVEQTSTQQISPAFDGSQVVPAQQPYVRAVSKRDKKTGGVGVRDGRIVIDNWAAWVDHAPRAMRQAIQAGKVTSEEVLTHVFRTALPQYTWPPEEDSPLYTQWLQLVPVMVQSLGMDKPVGRPRLRVVSA